MAKPINQVDSNYSRIFHLIHSKPKISKQEIANRLSLSLPTVTLNLKLLNENSLIETAGKLTSQVGRRAIAYSTNDNYRMALGLSISRHQVRLSAVNLSGNESFYEVKSLNYENSDAYTATVCDWIIAMTKAHDVKDNQVLGLGIGVQGLVSYDGKTILYGKILNSTGRTTDVYQSRLPYPVSFFHDADCVAYAEHILSGETRDTIYLSISEHLGTAIMINNHIYSGEHGRSGTIEHVTLNTKSDRQCYCGRYGCIETYCSISSLLNDDEELDTFIAQIPTNMEIRQRWNAYLNYLAEAINNLHMFMDNRIVLAGDLAQYLTTDTISELNERIQSITAFPEDKSYIQLGKVVSHPVSIGAGLPLIEAFLEAI